MNQREHDFLNKINETSEDIKVPKSLEPKEIGSMLEKRPKKFVWKRSYAAGVAACCLLACGAIYGVSRLDAGRPTESTAGAETETGEDPGGAEFQTAESYEDIYGYLEAYLDQGSDLDAGLFSGEWSTSSSEEAVMETAPAADAVAPQSKSAGVGTGNYSETNVRQEGVDEADVVKTDGRYLYTLEDNGRAVAVVDTTGGELKAVGEVRLENNDNIREFYVADGKLVLVGTRYNGEEDMSGGYTSSSSTFAVTYDLADPAEPEKIGEITQSGDYTSSRMVEGYLYLFSQYYVYGGDISAKDTENYIPLINGKLVPADDIFLPSLDRACMYQVICSADMEKPDQVKDSKAVFAESGELYVSNNNIYWYESHWGNNASTVIRSISYKEGKLAAKASGSVDGYIHDSFCIDEYKGYLRVITTEENTNSVYVLDGELEITGEIIGLAEDESVYSARLLGDVGYFVTYRETDPLFSVDFSDPKNPKIIGELKIPGFSEYLHFYGEDKLLGIGIDVDEDGFTTNGVKLSMFDISDSTDVQEVQKYVMENVYSADVMYDYRAALIDTDKNIIGFSAYSGEGEKYYVFSYDESEGFRCLMAETVNGSGDRTARGVYIDDMLYVVKGNIIEAYSMEDYQKTDDIIL